MGSIFPAVREITPIKKKCMKNALFYESNQMCQLAINASCIVHISHS